MPLTDTEIYHYSERIIRAINSVIGEILAFESILVNITFCIDKSCSTACTNSKCIRFGPKFLDNLSDRELEFVVIHEVLHIALEHPKLGYLERRAGKNMKIFNLACDIVVNSIILEIYNDDIYQITLNRYGESVHTTPDGREGRLFSVEEVYEMLVNNNKQKCA